MERAMRTFTLAGIAAMLSILTATAGFAQPMNDEPGMAAFYHPDRDPNDGSVAPAGAMAMVPVAGKVVMKMKMMPHARRAPR
jgi:hypothetical protein